MQTPAPEPRKRAAEPPARLLVVLLFAYPLLTHLAVHLHSLLLTSAAAVLLLALALRAPLHAGRAWAWALLAVALAAVAWSGFGGGRHDARLVLYAAPVLVYLFLAWFFGRTLRRGRVALITRLAEQLHGDALDDRAAVGAYTRRLTAVWTVLFLLIAATNAALAMLASPDGVLELAGLRSPWPVAATTWSLFANFLSFGLVLLLFALEFGWRRRRFPRQHARYRGLLDFLLHMRAAAPALLHGPAPTVLPADRAPDPATAAPRLQPTRSRRPATLLLLLAAHLLGAGLLLAGHGWSALAIVVGSHLLVVWGTLLPSSSVLGPLVTRFDSAGREIWLTIDDGPSADTAALLDLLDAHAARATFFLIGARAEARPALVAEIRRRGHGIGNHSLEHRAAWFWATPPRAMARQIGAAQQVLQRLAGEPPRLFRAVVGMSNLFVDPLLRRHGLLRVGWSARGYDSISADPGVVWARLQRDLRPGAILLLHEGAAHGASVAILARVLAELDRRGYRCVLPALPDAARSATTSQLLNGVPPHNGVKVARSPASASSEASASRSG